MKKTLLTLAMTIAGYCSYAQWTTSGSNIYNSNTGNVGIGTNSPLTPFDIKLTTNQHIQFVSNVNGGYLGASGIVCINDANSAYTPLGLYASNFYFGGGNVGIGTTSPNSRLQVDGTLSAINLTSTLGSSTPVIYGSIGNAYSTWGVSINHVVEDAGSNVYGMALLTTDSYLTGRTEKVRITGNGNVGIGTTTPDAKLAVNGTIHSKEVKVDLSVPGPDYVFNTDYKLTDLNELKTYLEKNHHLPEIPSAEQMAKDGINLSDMNVKLLKKVEELTLYLIKKDEQVNDQAKQIAEQNKEINDQQNQLREQSKKIEQQQQVNLSLQEQINELAKKLNK